MNFLQAKRALRKLLGDKAAWRYDENAPTADEREAISATLEDLTAAAQTARDAMKARRYELLRDPEYLRLRAECEAAEMALSNACSRARHYRVTIGSVTNMGGLALFTVQAEGDNWQDALDKLKAKKGGA